MAVAKYSQRRDSGNEIRRLILILNLHIILQKIRKCQFSSLIKQPLHIHVYVHGWGKRSSNNENQVDIKIPNKGTAKECLNCHTITLISYTSKVILKILQARVQQYVNQELPDVQAGFRKGGRIRNQIANTHWITGKVREFQKNIYFCFIDHTKVFDYMDHKKKLLKILKETGIPDHLTCLLRNLYTGQEATVRTRYGTTDWFQIGKGVHQGCILSPCLFYLYAEYIM